MAITIDLEQAKHALVAAVGGRLDGATAPQLDDRIAELVRAGQPTVLDLSGLTYASSAGLRVLLKFAKQAKASRVRLVLSGLTPAVKEVFDISGFTAIFEIKPDRDQALAAIG